MYKKKIVKSEIFFYIKNQRFKFLKYKHSIDTCNANYLKRINLSEADKITGEEFYFYKNKIEKESYWKGKMPKPPMSINKLHQYFKIVILEN